MKGAAILENAHALRRLHQASEIKIHRETIQIQVCERHSSVPVCVV